MGRPPLDLTGQTFGRLTAVRPVGRAHRYVLWECRCSCGATARKTVNLLRSGGVMSCGCWRKEQFERVRRRRGEGRGAKYAELRAAGLTLEHIADMFGVTHQAVSRVLRYHRGRTDKGK
jgi:hypothetical protein